MTWRRTNNEFRLLIFTKSLETNHSSSDSLKILKGLTSFNLGFVENPQTFHVLKCDYKLTVPFLLDKNRMFE